MLYRLHFERSVHWILRAEDPAETPLVAFPGWFLVNPAVVLQTPAWRAPALMCSDGERELVLVNELTFRTPLHPPVTPEHFQPVLKWLRFASGQQHLAASAVAGSLIDEHALGEKTWDPSSDTGWGALRHIEMTAISHQLLTSKHLPSTAEVPVYADVLLDAIHADNSGDDIKTVLYCAIAIECVAANRIAHDFARAVVDTPGRLRLRQADDHSAKEDAIYESLRRRAQRDFRILMHELPIYVSGRSLMKDEPRLYQEVHALRKARNDFVHAGKAPANAVETYRLAKTALATAFQVFHWFNAEGRFVSMRGHSLGAS